VYFGRGVDIFRTRGKYRTDAYETHLGVPGRRIVTAAALTEGGFVTPISITKLGSPPEQRAHDTLWQRCTHHSASLAIAV
jgi:hypothetical protein